MIHKNQEKGFTLVELIVGMAIAAIILSGVVQLIGSSIRTQTNSTAKINDMQSGRVAIDKISEELKYAFANSVKADNGTMSDSGIYFTRTDDIVGNKKTRHIYLKAGTDGKGGTVVIEEGPYPQIADPWEVSKSTSYGMNAVRELTFSISAPSESSIIDPDFNDKSITSNNIQSKRKTITITLIINSAPTNSLSPNNLSDRRRTELTTQVTTQNMQ